VIGTTLLQSIPAGHAISEKHCSGAPHSPGGISMSLRATFSGGLSLIAEKTLPEDPFPMGSVSTNPGTKFAPKLDRDILPHLLYFRMGVMVRGVLPSEEKKRKQQTKKSKRAREKF